MHWRSTGNQAILLLVDARASYPLLLFLVHWAYWTFGLWVASVIFFGALRYYGYTVPNAVRMFRAKLAGRYVDKKPFWRKPKMTRIPVQ